MKKVNVDPLALKDLVDNQDQLVREVCLDSLDSKVNVV